MVEHADEAWQDGLDGLCHRVGIGVVLIERK
jgi:hypothetical protein